MCSAEHQILVISKMSISSPNPMFDYLLDSSHQDDFDKWLNVRFGEVIKQVALIKVNFTNLIRNSIYALKVLNAIHES